MRITNTHLIMAACVAGLAYYMGNKKKIDPTEPVYKDGLRVVKPLSELNPNGGGSIFERFGNGR